jgi:hypothetical protein
MCIFETPCTRTVKRIGTSRIAYPRRVASISISGRNAKLSLRNVRLRSAGAR